MALTTVTVDGMRSALTTMEQTVDTSRTNLNNVENNIAGLTTTWTGAAAQQFSNALQAWEQDCTRILNSMKSMIDSMQGSLTTYQDTEHVNAGSVSRLRDSFGSQGSGAPAPSFVGVSGSLSGGSTNLPHPEANTPPIPMSL